MLQRHIAETSILSEGKKKKKRTWAIVQVKSLPLQQDYRPKARGFCLCTWDLELKYRLLPIVLRPLLLEGYMIHFSVGVFEVAFRRLLYFFFFFESHNLKKTCLVRSMFILVITKSSECILVNEIENISIFWLFSFFFPLLSTIQQYVWGRVLNLTKSMELSLKHRLLWKQSKIRKQFSLCF